MAEVGFQDKVVIITGAARGLGFGIASAFANEHAHVVITDVDADGGRLAAEKLEKIERSVSFEALDVRRPEACSELVEKVVKKFGQIDIWINNAGVSHLGPAESLPNELWQESLDVMLSGPLYCCQAVGPHMLKRGQGVIINVASVTGMKPIEGRVAYSVPKAGLIMLTEQLGIEWAKRGVRVAGVAPAVVNTEMVQQAAKEGHLSVEACVRRTPMRRLGEIDEIAEAVLYLASDSASYVVGETLRVDGGWVAYQLF